MYRVLAFVIGVLGSTAAFGAEPPACFAPSQSAPAFAFEISKPDQVSRDEIQKRKVDQNGLDFLGQVHAGTAFERAGAKRSQRSEIKETFESSQISRNAEWLCYEFSFKIPNGTAVPARERNGKRAKLTIAQFHQERVGIQTGSAVLFFDIDPRGRLITQTGNRLGSRSSVLLKKAIGLWVDVRVAARWSKDRKRGRTIIWVREPSKGEAFQLKLDESRKNATTGHVYQKLGPYRSFLERDPGFAETQVVVQYDGVRRNGRPADLR